MAGKTWVHVGNGLPRAGCGAVCDNPREDRSRLMRAPPGGLGREYLALPKSTGVTIMRQTDEHDPVERCSQTSRNLRSHTFSPFRWHRSRCGYEPSFAAHNVNEAPTLGVGLRSGLAPGL